MSIGKYKTQEPHETVHAQELPCGITPEAHHESGRATDKLNCACLPFNSWLGKRRLGMEHLQLCRAGAWCGDSAGAGLRVPFFFCFITCRKLLCLPGWCNVDSPVSAGISRERFPAPPWSSGCPYPSPGVSLR